MPSTSDQFSSVCTLKQTEAEVHTGTAVEESIEDVLRNLQWSDSSSDELLISSTNLEWNDVTGENFKLFPEYTENLNIHKNVRLMKDKSPADFFFLFVDDELLNVIVQQTNLYASQKSVKTTLPWARIRSWKDTNIEEMKLFIGLLFWIGLVQMPKLNCYWSNNLAIGLLLSWNYAKTYWIVAAQYMLTIITQVSNWLTSYWNDKLT